MKEEAYITRGTYEKTSFDLFMETVNEEEGNLSDMATELNKYLR